MQQNTIPGHVLLVSSHVGPDNVSKNIQSNNEIPLKFYFGTGETELVKIYYSNYSGLGAWADAGFARVIISNRFATSLYHKWCDVSFAWQCTKQSEPGASTNDVEMRSLFKTLCYHSICHSLNEIQEHPTHSFNISSSIIAQVLNDRITHQVKHIDMVVIWLNEQFFRKRLTPITCRSQSQQADMNMKLHGGMTLQKKFTPLV